MNVKYKKFQELSFDEIKEVLEWRNNPDIRKWMYNKEKISLEEHLKFIENLKKDSAKIYIKVDDLGVVNFKIFDHFAELGIHKNPKKKKVGRELLRFAVNYAFNNLKLKKLILYVFEDNIRAKTLYKNIGFIELEKKDNLIKMELLNENW
ncbi:UDP-4-amino-4,6-dideoxy-N-acetyl-beta-L-altrosamine N-acetyltransferase [Nautilia lithotrophica]